MSFRRCFEKAEKLYASGYWDEAETLFQKVIKICEISARPSRSHAYKMTEAIARLHSTASAMHRKDDAELWARMKEEHSNG